MIQAGFEFEFGHDIRMDLLKQVIRFHYPNNKIYTVNDNNDVYDILSTKYFIFKDDTSVRLDNCKYKSTEISTPVFIGIKNILENFKKIFYILHFLNVKTNNTCSIHINVSFTDYKEIHKIDLGKLYVFINELETLKIFKRSNNLYSKPIMSYNKCKKIIEDASNNQDILKRIEKYMLLLADDHHRSIALDKQKNNELNIIEFRFIGGNYIDRFNDCNNILVKVLNGMNFSIRKNTQNTKQIIRKFKHYYKCMDF
jgi:hypothetical protein